MELFELALEFGEVLLVDEILHQILTRPALFVDELLHQPHAAEQVLHLREMRLERFLRLVFEGIGHGASIPEAPRLYRAIQRGTRALPI